ncbi:glycerophosphodiester phosphodiesterase family protein [Novosphingobium sp.]|uniref:glycerophosphodiester phosphodiesterase family protein n=1 Tax=Novosphingobium sp. TaxID=1874826 RepID=UPI0025F192E6|nr:glycerophosphodiester phosphodiesterase family protein [Novosphingobium sp.]MCC6927080.1 glycerophosphodiester phosphodiesterase [Novosphingobium sp.]
MKIWIKRVALVLAIAFLALSFVNASWLADSPRGYIKLIAHRGTYQLFSHDGLERDTCTATRIEAPSHDYLENTLAGMGQAVRNGAQMIELDIAPTRDGKLAVFHDWTLDCRTDGKGNVRDATMAELKALDAGYGYSADGGKTFPLRGKGVGLIPELSEVLAAFPDRPLLFNFKSQDPAEADLLFAALRAAGRDPVARGDGFYGGTEQGPIARIRQLLPRAWVFSKESAKACTKAYALQGWLALTPEACRGGTLIIPLNRQWLFAGWPNRLVKRMDAVGARIIIAGPQDGPGGLGLDLPEQIRQIPAGFTGYVWVEDIRAVGPAVRPAFGKRNPREEKELQDALQKRRTARE